MNEKTMVADALVGINGELKMFGEMIPQTENKELKQCLKQIRNSCEMSQEKLYEVARQKSYYVPAAKATEQEVIHSDSTDNALIFSAASPAASLYRSRRGGFLCLKTSPIRTYIRFFSKISNFSYNPKNSLLS